jgi:4,5-DOPA dioxygenase extradiol
LPPHAEQFENWLCDSIASGRRDDLIDWETQGPQAVRNHPTPEHFLPLFAPLGAASDPHGRIMTRRFELVSLSMAAFCWD